MILAKTDILNKPFINIDKISALKFIPLSDETEFLEHEITAFFGAANREIGRSLTENCSGFPVGVYHGKDLCVLYDGCLFTGKELVAAESLNFRDASRPILEHFLNTTLSEVSIDDTCILLYGPGWPTWGHWVIDFFTRVFTAFKIGIAIWDTKWIIPSECPDFARALIKRVGIKDENIISFDHRSQYLRCKSIFVPTNLTCGMSCHPLMKDYIVWFRKIIGISQSYDINQRIFLSRQLLDTKRRIANSVEIENILIDYGYRIMHPELFSLQEQIDIYSRSAVIFSEYGSASHNSIFAPSDAFIGCLRGNMRSVGFIQSALCRAAGQKFCYIFGEHSNNQEAESFRIDPRDLHDALRFVEKKIKITADRRLPHFERAN